MNAYAAARSALTGVVCAFFGCLTSTPPAAIAQETFQGAVPSAQSAAALGVAGAKSPDAGLALEDWLVYPAFFAGAVFNDNVYARPSNRVAALGLRIAPSFEAVRDNGLHKTMAYLGADAQIYPGLGVGSRLDGWRTTYDPSPTNVTGRAGLSHLWEPLEDLNLRFSLDFARQSGVFAPGFGDTASQAYLTSIGGFSSAQQYVNQISGTIAVEKKISERTFVRAMTTGQYLSYDSRPTTASAFGGIGPNGGFGSSAFGGLLQDGYDYRAMVRGGAWVTPQIYGFVEPGIDLRRYRKSAFDTNGWRLIGGLGSDMIGLFRGEVYGGYQRQSSVTGQFGGAASPTYGARLFYYPTRDITLTASVDQTLSSAVARSAVGPGSGLGVVPGVWSGAAFAGPGLWRGGGASRTRQAMLQAEYLATSFLTLHARGGYGETFYGGGGPSTLAWTGGVGLAYTFWRNVALTLDYQFTRTRLRADPLTRLSAAAGLGYARNMLSAGIAYRF